ncbi:MAG: hypothetical protein FWF13_03645 [Acidobacteria bacterium]|nr:hypothetical protein [Acidobacteriota bacterium]
MVLKPAITNIFRLRRRILRGRANPMTGTTKTAGVTRTSMHQLLSKDGRPTFETVAKIARSLGYRIALVRETTPAG